MWWDCYVLSFVLCVARRVSSINGDSFLHQPIEQGFFCKFTLACCLWFLSMSLVVIFSITGGLRPQGIFSFLQVYTTPTWRFGSRQGCNCLPTRELTTPERANECQSSHTSCTYFRFSTTSSYICIWLELIMLNIMYWSSPKISRG